MASVHSFKKGDVVTIFQMSPSKGLFIEGDALIVKVLPVTDEHYKVRFYRKSNGQIERESYERFVDRDGQSDPVAYVREFNRKIGVAA